MLGEVVAERAVWFKAPMPVWLTFMKLIAPIIIFALFVWAIVMLCATPSVVSEVPSM